MDKVQWQNEQGGWEIGRIFTFTDKEKYQLAVTPFGAGLVGHLIDTDRVLIIPCHDQGNPVFVQYGKLTPRPDQHQE